MIKNIPITASYTYFVTSYDRRIASVFWLIHFLFLLATALSCMLIEFPPPIFFLFLFQGGGGSGGAAGGLKFTVADTCERIKEEFNFIQQQNHSWVLFLLSSAWSRSLLVFLSPPAPLAVSLASIHLFRLAFLQDPRLLTPNACLACLPPAIFFAIPFFRDCCLNHSVDGVVRWSFRTLLFGRGKLELFAREATTTRRRVASRRVVST